MVTTSTEFPGLAGIRDDFRGLIRDLSTNVTSALQHVALIKEQEAACPDENRTWAGPLPLPPLTVNTLWTPLNIASKQALAASSQSCWKEPQSSLFFHYVPRLLLEHAESSEQGFDSAVSLAIETALLHWLTSNDTQGRLLRARLMRLLSEVARVDAEQELNVNHGAPNSESLRIFLTPTQFCPTVAPSPQTAVAAERPAPAADDEVVTSEEAAKLLHVSRTHVNKLVEKGELGEVRKTEGGHRRILRSAVMSYKEKSKASQLKGLEQMMAASAALGHYDDEMNNVPLRRKS